MTEEMKEEEIKKAGGWDWLTQSWPPVCSAAKWFFRWGGAALLIVGPPIYLAYHPEHFTPAVQALLAILLFLLALWIGQSQEAAKAAQRANDRWLPQAESVIFRLLTLQANVERFSKATEGDCRQSECDLPELKQKNMRALRIKMKTECVASSRRLDDIAHQLEDAIEDWRRFIAANCVGDECARIFDAVEQRKASLLGDGSQNNTPAEGSEGTT